MYKLSSYFIFFVLIISERERRQNEDKNKAKNWKNEYEKKKK